MKASDFIARFLSRRGVKNVFEMSGGMITHLLDSLATQTSISIISVHHEQAAAFAADAVGRMTGLPGVALATSGPGATNLLTGMGSAYFDSSPALFITGQVNRHELKGARGVRQQGFQETDIVSMAKPITKAAWQIEQPEDLPAALNRAFDIARSGRPGPVLLDIPMDIQRATITDDENEADEKLSLSSHAIDAAFLDRLTAALESSQRPLFILGGGIRSACVAELVRQFVQTLKVPAVHSLLGVDVLAADDPWRVGMLGSYGNRWANLAVGQSDLLLVLGSRLDIRQTGSDTRFLETNRKIFHVDIDSSEMNNRVQGCDVLTADLKNFLETALQDPRFKNLSKREAWLSTIQQLQMQWPDTAEIVSPTSFNPNTFMHDLSRASRLACAYVVDTGQHQMWAAQSLEIGSHQRFLTSGGMGAMGFALPAAIGAAITTREPVVMIAGDGGFQTNLHELQTVIRNKLPIKMVILNNQTHGMVRQFQESYFEGRYQSTLWGYSAPDFARVAEAFGIDALTIREAHETARAMQWLWADPARPALLQVMIQTDMNVYPKIAFGKPMTDMEPFAVPTQMEST